MSFVWDRLCFPHLCALAGKNPSKLSQAMHNAAFRALNLPFSYVAFNTTDTAFVIEAMRRLGIRGLSLTIPHKEIAFSLVDEVEGPAQKVGAINTVVNSGATLTGFNTDVFGITQALREAHVDDLSGKNVLILGAGGAARAAIYAAGELGATSVSLANRTDHRAELLAKDFSGQNVIHLRSDELPNVSLADFTLIINATPLGSIATDSAELKLDLSQLGENICVFDMATRTSTPLLE
ncbi:MAG: hypothetical protein IT291_06650, partial [Deltaproteobacteria bacterium]|nr:hypothetical protein [Deltaproteobacteria bacterium]